MLCFRYFNNSIRTVMFEILNIIVIYLCIANISCCAKDDKLLLSPVELIDLVREEQHKFKTSPLQKMFHTVEMPYDEEEGKYQSEDEPEELDEDDKTLKNRKMWSRWSKWGECSVTCGGGTIARHRVCVAGRCAHGEREEQHRPCSRAPCHVSTSKVTDEQHELE